MQVPRFTLENPAMHRQSEDNALPFDDVEDAGQLVQIEEELAPTASEYVPARQSVHAVFPEPVENFPAGQWVQFDLEELLASGENLPAGHSAHTRSDTAVHNRT